jgi:hypothetical protein
MIMAFCRIQSKAKEEEHPKATSWHELIGLISSYRRLN